MSGRERDITVLLGELGLQRYAATFEDEDFTDPALLLSMRRDLRQPSLEELGMCAQLVHATATGFGVRTEVTSLTMRCVARRLPHHAALLLERLRYRVLGARARAAARTPRGRAQGFKKKLNVWIMFKKTFKYLAKTSGNV